MGTTRKFLMLLFILSMALPVRNSAAESALPDKMVFSLIAGTESQNDIAGVLKKVYGRLGISASFVSLPSGRALEYSNSGRTDGEVFRIKAINKKYTNLVRVPTPVMTFRGMAYATKNIAINTWEDLKPYRVGIVRGIVWAERGTKDLKVARFESNIALFERLLAGGVDVIVSTSYTLDTVIADRHSDTRIYKGSPLMKFDVFHFLHQKHAHLVDKVDRQIQQLVAK